MTWFRPIGPIGLTTSNTTTSGSHNKSHNAGWNAAIGKAQSGPGGTAGVGQVGPGPWTGWPSPGRPSPGSPSPGWLWPWRMPGVLNPMTIVTPPRKPGPNVPGCTRGPGIGVLGPGAPGPVMKVSLPCRLGPPRNVTPPGKPGPHILGTPPGGLSLPKNVTPLPDPWPLINVTPPGEGPRLIMNKAAGEPPKGGGSKGEPPGSEEPEEVVAAVKAAKQARRYAKRARRYASKLSAMSADVEEKALPREKAVQIHKCWGAATAAAALAERAARQAGHDAVEAKVSPETAILDAVTAEYLANKAGEYRSTARNAYWQARKQL